MGNYMFHSGADEYGVWARQRDTDQYVEAMQLTHYEPDDPNTLTDALGIFRREVNMFALQRKYVDARVLYLYKGSARFGRAELKEDGAVLELTFRDAATMLKWRHADEVLAPKEDGGTEWPLAQSGFDAAFDGCSCDDDDRTLRYRRIAE